jgi:hypothetical protein
MTQAQNLANLSQLYTGFPLPFRNRIMNGAARVSQRTVAAAPVNGGWFNGLADRWQMYAGAPAGALSLSILGASSFGGIPNRNWLYVTVQTPPSDLTGTNMIVPFRQVIEGVNAYDLTTGPMWLSFLFNAAVTGQYSINLLAYDTAGALIGNYPAVFNHVAGTPKPYTFFIPQMPGTYALAGGTGPGVQLSIGALNTGTYQATAGQLNQWNTSTSAVYYTAAGNVNWAATANNYLTATDIQLELFDLTQFERRPYTLELDLCQRYYYCIGNGSSGTIAVMNSLITAPTVMVGIIQLPQRMRLLTGKTVVTVNMQGSSAAQVMNGTAQSLIWETDVAVGYQLTCNGATWTAGQAGVMYAATGFWALNSEF